MHLNAQDIAVLKAIQSQAHDWAVREPQCLFAYVAIDARASRTLLKGPPIEPFIGPDARVIEKSEDWRTGHPHIVEHKIFVGPLSAGHAFQQLASELNVFIGRGGDWKARRWFDYLFELASTKEGVGAVTVQPSTWMGTALRTVGADESMPSHVFGMLHNSPFLASELAISRMLANTTGELTDTLDEVEQPVVSTSNPALPIQCYALLSHLADVGWDGRLIDDLPEDLRNPDIRAILSHRKFTLYSRVPKGAPKHTGTSRDWHINLTPAGRAALAEWRLQHQPLPTVGAEVLSKVVEAKPNYDSDRRELTFDGQVVKRFRQPAENQVRVISAFQEEGWPVRIDDPLPPRKRNETIRGLNENMQIDLIRFVADGTGEGIRWERMLP